MTYQFKTPVDYFADLSGRPIELGEVYIGVANQDPELNPINVYWDADGTNLAAQPLSLSAGYIVHSGDRAQVYALVPEFSVRVLDKAGQQVIDIPSAAMPASAVTVDTFMQRFVFADDFGDVGPSVDSSVAINLAIASIAATGGTVYLPVGTKCHIDNPIVIGDGTTGVHSTYGAIKLAANSAVAGIGNSNPLGGAHIESGYAGPAIKIDGLLEGWGLENLFISFSTVNTAAIGIQLTEAGYGSLSNVTITNPPGGGLLLTTRNQNNTYLNEFRNLRIWLGSTYTNYGVKLTAASGGAGGDPAHNRFYGLFIIPNIAGQKGVWLQCCDTNFFSDYVYNAAATASDAIYLDYGVNSDFPAGNIFYGGCDWYGHNITQNGSPSTLATPFSNRLSGLVQGNSSRISRSTSGLAIDRIKLAQNTNFYVDDGGSDSGSTGLYAAGPWATLQHAYDWIVSQYDLNGYNATISVGAGTYSAGINAVIPPVGNGKIVVVGAGGTSAFSGTGPIFKAGPGCRIELQSLNLSPSAGVSVDADGGEITIGTGVVFGAASAEHARAENNGRIVIGGSYFILGGATAHFSAIRGGAIVESGTYTCTALASVSITNFASADVAGNILLPTWTFVIGAFTITGSRYLSTNFASIDVNGRGGNIFPGTAGGTAVSGLYR